MKRIVGTLVIGLMVCAPSALGGPWESPGGNGDGFTYANGQDINGLFGSPVVYGNTFHFLYANFQVEAVDGGSASQSDTTSFDITVESGLFFSTMTVQAFGSYSIVGEGSADLNSGIELAENAGIMRNWSGPLNTTPAFPITSGSGGWSGDAMVDVTWEFPTPADSMHVELSCIIDAIAGDDGSSEINVQYENLVISFGVIPEPASLLLFGLGGLGLLRRRR